MTQTKPSPSQDDRSIDIQDTKKVDEKQPRKETGFELPNKGSEPESKESRNNQ